MIRFYAALAALGALLAFALKLIGLGRQSLKADITEAALKAERDRLELDDEINRDPDLAARARRIGLVRPD